MGGIEGSTKHQASDVPCSRVGCVWPDEQVVFLVGDEVDPAKVHGLVSSVEADVSFLGLARVSGRPYDQSVDVAEDALIFRVRVGASHPVAVAQALHAVWNIRDMTKCQYQFF